MSFDKINLIKPLRKALVDQGYQTPTPIQQQAIPIILERKDLLGCAQTGTGKTAAFALPIIQILHLDKPKDFRKKYITSLIVTPTRELAIQIGDSFKAYGKYTRLKYAVVFGGVPQKAQTDKLKSGVDVLIATPGRLLDLMQQNYISLGNIKLFVLDEADRMLDMGFINDVRKIIAQLPAKRQSLFFSATMPPEIVKLAGTILTKPVKVEVTPESTTVEKIKQSVFHVAKPDKKKLLIHLLKDSSVDSALVFTRTKHGADHVARILNRNKISADAIHGNKTQNARQRALTNFKTRKTRVLVATDIAARGIDIDELSHVINYEIPNVPETYVHRIGRTGRAGLDGTAISLCDAEERAFLKDINRLIAKPIPVVKDHPFELNLTEESPAAKTDTRKTSGGNKNGNPARRTKNSENRNGRRTRQRRQSK